MHLFGAKGMDVRSTGFEGHQDNERVPAEVRCMSGSLKEGYDKQTKYLLMAWGSGKLRAFVHAKLRVRTRGFPSTATEYKNLKNSSCGDEAQNTGSI